MELRRLWRARWPVCLCRGMGLLRREGVRGGGDGVFGTRKVMGGCWMVDDGYGDYFGTQGGKDF